MTANAGMSVVCERCGSLFHVKPSQLQRYNTRFCSRACRKNTEADFWAKVDRRGPDECWPWTGRARVRDYGRMNFGDRAHLANRLAFFLTQGRWPENARHSCDNPPCCNPAHILEGTHTDNMRDAVARGRRPRGEAMPQAKLTEASVRAIRIDPRSHLEIAPFYGVHPATICRLRARKIWRHV